MTKETIKTIAKRNLSEFFEGYVLVARVAGRSEVVVLCDVKDLPTRSALVTALNDVLQSKEFINACNT